MIISGKELSIAYKNASNKDPVNSAPNSKSNFFYKCLLLRIETYNFTVRMIKVVMKVSKL